MTDWCIRKLCVCVYVVLCVCVYSLHKQNFTMRPPTPLASTTPAGMVRIEGGAYRFQTQGVMIEGDNMPGIDVQVRVGEAFESVCICVFVLLTCVLCCYLS